MLLGDVGGTKTLLGVEARDGGIREVRRYPSAEHQALASVVRRYLAETGLAPRQACFAIAGPVRDGRARATNLPWTLDEADLRASLGLERVRLVNDIQAVAAAIPVLPASAFAPLRDVPADPAGVLGVVAPGTGLGMGFRVPCGGDATVLASEGGHVAFAPRDEEQAALLAWLRPRFGHVSVERVASGSGVPHLYQFLRDTGRCDEPAWLRETLRDAADATPVILDAGREGRGEICVHTLDLFVRILGGVLGDLAVQLLPRAGLVLAGGIPPRILDRLRKPDFEEAFLDKGRFRGLVATIPLAVLLDPEAPLRGARRLA